MQGCIRIASSKNASGRPPSRRRDLQSRLLRYDFWQTKSATEQFMEPAC